MTANEILTNRVFNPGESAELTRQHIIDTAHATGGITMGLPAVDRIMVPWRAPNLITLLGAPSHYKSGLANYVARHALAQCTEPNDVIFKVVFEQSVEEDTLLNLAQRSGIGVKTLAMGAISDVQEQLLEKSTVELAYNPLWIIGYSSVQARKQRKVQEMLNLQQVRDLLEWTINEGAAQPLNPKLIVVDYLQIIPAAGNNWRLDERLKVKEQLAVCKQMAISFDCPVLVASQVGRDGYGAAPSLTSGAESSAIEWFSDTVIGSWIPHKTMLGQQLELAGRKWMRDGAPLMVDRTLYVMRLLKQKTGEAPHEFIMEASWEKNEIFPLEGRIEPAPFEKKKGY